MIGRTISQYTVLKKLGSGGMGEVYLAHDTKLEEFVELKKEQSKRMYISLYGIAQIYADLGREDEVFEWLNKTYEAHDNRLAYLNVDPHWDAVRSDPRFAELIQKVRLPPPKQ